MKFFADQTFKVKTNPVCTSHSGGLSLSSFNADKNKVMDGHKRQDYEGICVDLLLNFFCGEINPSSADTYKNSNWTLDTYIYYQGNKIENDEWLSNKKKPIENLYSI